MLYAKALYPDCADVLPHDAMFILILLDNHAVFSIIDTMCSTTVLQGRERQQPQRFSCAEGNNAQLVWDPVQPDGTFWTLCPIII